MKDSARVVELTVETVSEIRGRVYVLARASEDDSPILVTSRSTLDGVPVEPWLDVPRSLDPSGAPRTNLVAFCLRFAPDQARFRPGERVVFISDAGHSSERQWLEPWQAVDQPRRLERELSLEVGPAHQLFRVPAVAIGRRIDTDDVLFEIQDERRALAHVHLTWTSKQEAGADWPRTRLFESWADWVHQMRADHGTHDPEAD